MKESELRKGNPIWITLGFIFSILGGFLGFIIALNYLVKRNKYDQSTRNTAWVMLVLAFVMMLVYRALFY